MNVTLRTNNFLLETKSRLVVIKSRIWGKEYVGKNMFFFYENFFFIL